MTINVADIRIETKVINVTTKVLKQMRMLQIGEYNALIGINKSRILGWFDGQAAGIADGCWLLCKVGEGDYRIFNSHYEAKNHFPQIFI